MRKKGEGSYSDKIINGILYKRYRFPDGKEVCGRTAAIRDQKIEEYRQQLLNTPKTKVIKNRATFGGYCQEWLKGKQSELSERTYDDYEDIIRVRLTDYKQNRLADVYLESLCANHIQIYLNDLADAYSYKSVIKTWVILKNIIKDGIKKKYIPEFDLSDIKTPKEKNVAVQKKVIPVIDLDDMEKLYEECLRKYSNDVYVYGNNAYIIIFIMYTGLRISEAIGLKWKNVGHNLEDIRVIESATRVVVRDEDGNPIRHSDGNKTYINKQKDPKTESGQRTVPLTERAIWVLKEMMKFNPGRTKDDYVFLTSNHTKMSARNIQRTLAKIQANSECRVKNYTPHALRHGYGSILLSKGTDIKTVSKLLGHKSVTTTYDIYIDVYKEEVAEQVRNVFDKKEESKVQDTKQESTQDIFASIREAKQLLDEGVLTEEEFAQIKARLLK